MRRIAYSLRSSYRREGASHPNRKLKLFLIIFLFNIIVFGYFGVFRGVTSIVRKRELIEQYVEMNRNLEANFATVQLLEPFVKGGKGAFFVHDAITDEPQTVEYLEELVKQTGRQGFILEKFSVKRELLSEGEIEIRVSFLGNENRSFDLLNAIESFDRLTKVETVSIDYGHQRKDLSSGTVNVKMKLNIYKVERSQ